MHNLSRGNDLKRARKTHFNMKGYAARLVLVFLQLLRRSCKNTCSLDPHIRNKLNRTTLWPITRHGAIQWTNQYSNQINAADAKRGKTCNHFWLDEKVAGVFFFLVNHGCDLVMQNSSGFVYAKVQTRFIYYLKRDLKSPQRFANIVFSPQVYRM